MKVARRVEELAVRPRAATIGTFDGVHLGHRSMLETLIGSGLTPTVVTFDPHPRTVLGNRVELISTLERRLELLAQQGVEETLVLEFTQELAQTAPEAFVDDVLRRLGCEVIVAGEGFRFGHRRAGDLPLLARLGFDVRVAPIVEGMSSTRIRELVRAGDVVAAARLLGRPVEVEGTVVLGDQRGGTLGFPTANLAVAAELVAPAFGIYAGATSGRRAAVSIGTNPHYGGSERRVEAFLLEFEGDLYGQRLVVELWARLRDERAFATEADLVAQIARDVEATRTATRPL